MCSKKQYSDELKEQIIKECQEAGNVAIVARRYNISSNTIHTWLKKYRKTGSVKTLPKAEKDRNKILEKQLQIQKLILEKEDVKYQAII